MANFLFQLLGNRSVAHCILVRESVPGNFKLTLDLSDYFGRPGCFVRKYEATWFRLAATCCLFPLMKSLSHSDPADASEQHAVP